MSIDVDEMRKKFGDSNEESRQAVIDAHNGTDGLREWATEWANCHSVFGDNNDMFVAYATAVDLGYRIGQQS